LTVVEVLVALVLLGVGVAAAAGASAATSRMITRGKSATRAAQAAARILDSLRAAAGATPGCTGLADGMDSAATGLVFSWRVAATANLRTITLVSSYAVPGRTRSDSFLTQLRCD